MKPTKLNWKELQDETLTNPLILITSYMLLLVTWLVCLLSLRHLWLWCSLFLLNQQSPVFITIQAIFKTHLLLKAFQGCWSFSCKQERQTDSIWIIYFAQQRHLSAHGTAYLIENLSFEKFYEPWGCLEKWLPNCVFKCWAMSRTWEMAKQNKVMHAKMK